MRLLHVISTLDPAAGGPVAGLRGLIDAGREIGVESEIVTMDAPSRPGLDAFAAPVAALAQSPQGFAYAPRLAAWLRLHQARFDAAVVHGLWQHQGIVVRRVLRQSRRPYLVFPHGMLDPWFKQSHRAKHLKKQLFWYLWQYRVLRDADAVLFTCEEEERLARTSFHPYAVRGRVVGFGASGPAADGDPRSRLEAAFAELRGKRVLLFLGRIHPKKGCDLLLEAFAGVAQSDPALQLVFAGPDQIGWGAQLRARARQLGVDGRVSWPGMLEGELKWAALRSAEAFVLPSHQENFGVAVAEALACATPVLLSDKVNIWREIVDEGAGLVADDTAAGTLTSLRAWLALEPAQRDAMRAAALHCHTRHFRFDAVAARLAAVVRESLRSRHGTD